MIEYVVGFLFSKDRSKVVLIRKSRPEWQAGMLNGPGGKVEIGETATMAIRREFRQECGCEIINWEEVVSLQCPSCRVYFFWAFGDLDRVKSGNKSLTDERVEILEVSEWRFWHRNSTVRPADWILEMCLDDDIGFPVWIDYATDGRRK